MQLRFNTRRQLIDALEARRKWAERHDAQIARKHRTDEDAVLKAFQSKCRELGKMSLTRLKSAVEESETTGRKMTKLLEYGSVSVNLPTCPASAVALLDDVLAVLAITRQETFTLNGDNKDVLYRAHWLLTADDSSKKRTVCA